MIERKNKYYLQPSTTDFSTNIFSLKMFKQWHHSQTMFGNPQTIPAQSWRILEVLNISHNPFSLPQKPSSFSCIHFYIQTLHTVLSSYVNNFASESLSLVHIFHFFNSFKMLMIINQLQNMKKSTNRWWTTLKISRGKWQVPHVAHTSIQKPTKAKRGSRWNPGAIVDFTQPRQC